MNGTILNVAGILIGAGLGLTRRRLLTPAWEAWLKVALAAFTALVGLRLLWLSLGGSFLQVLKQCFILVLALVLGRLLGRLLGLQRMSNSLGRQARERLKAATPANPNRAADGFKTCAALFCAAPLGIVGAIQDGLSLSQNVYPLAIKAVIDGLAAIGFASIFGPAVLLSALPVLAFQGSISFVCGRVLLPTLTTYGLVEATNAASGVLVVAVALVILDIKRIEMANYLPGLVLAPLLTWLCR